MNRHAGKPDDYKYELENSFESYQMKVFPMKKEKKKKQRG